MFKIRQYPIALCFTYDEFNSFRRDLAQFQLPLVHEFKFAKKLENSRIYGIPEEEMIYICFHDLGGTSVGFSEPHFLQFTKDALSFNPQGAFEGYSEHVQKRLSKWV